MIMVQEIGTAGYIVDDRVPPHEDARYRIIQIDEDRYSGVYSGSAFTAWPGVRPDDIDAGDPDCAEFWEKHPNAFHGSGNTAQTAFLDLVQKITARGWWDVEVTLQVVMLESYSEGAKAFLYGSDEFKAWLEEA